MSFISYYLQDFLFVLGFQQFKYNIPKCLRLFFCLFICWFIFVFILLIVLSLEILGAHILCMSLILENFDNYFFKYFLWSVFSLLLQFSLCFTLSHLYGLPFKFIVSSTQLYQVSDKTIEHSYSALHI